MISRSKLVNLNNISESKKSNVIFHSINSSFANLDENQNENFQLIHNYMELINQGSFLESKSRYYEALEIFEKALSISEKLKDEFKKNETKCNIGIINFYLGKLDEAINIIQPCYENINKICSSQMGMNNIGNLYLLCKSATNLCMIQLTINSENKNCSSLIENIINIISKEEDLYNQLFCIKFLNNALFRVNSLLNNKNNYYNKYISFENNNEEDNNFSISNEEEQYKQINKMLIESFDYFISSQKIEPWINSLNILNKKLKQLNDNNGLIFIIFNQQLAICLKNNEDNEINVNEEINDAKIKLTSLLQAINEVTNNNDIINNNHDNNSQIQSIINEEYINSIIEDYKSKIFVIREIYQKLYSFEEQIIGNIEEQDNYGNNPNINKINNNNSNDIIGNINTEFYIIFLLKYTIKYFKENIKDIKLKNDLIKDINNTLDLIYSKKIDISKINMSSLNPEISQSLSLLFNNIFQLYKKNKLKRYFKLFKTKSKIKNKNKNKEISKLDNFLEKNYNHIYKGENLLKINYNSSGINIHFYQIDYKNDLFESFSSNSNSTKPQKTYEFDNIIKVVVGIKTKNVKSKLKNISIDKINKPYLFMSLILRGRTIDLLFKKESSAKKWFYGLYQYFDISNRNYKIGSCTRNILFRIKCKMINQLEEDIKMVNKKSFSFCIKKYFKELKEKK